MRKPISFLYIFILIYIIPAESGTHQFDKELEAGEYFPYKHWIRPNINRVFDLGNERTYRNAYLYPELELHQKSLVMKRKIMKL